MISSTKSLQANVQDRFYTHIVRVLGRPKPIAPVRLLVRLGHILLALARKLMVRDAIRSVVLPRDDRPPIARGPFCETYV